MWAHRTPQEAHELLSEPDVTVTNESDKQIQLEKLLSLNEEVQAVLQPKSLAMQRRQRVPRL